jgi:hypothetical protein
MAPSGKNQSGEGLNNLFLQKFHLLKTTLLPSNAGLNIPDWATGFPYAITVCDNEAIILYMNEKSAGTFSGSGGHELVGKSLYDCHSPASCEIIKDLLATGRSNIYTIEKNGTRKLICQAPWFKDGSVAGLVEISIILPENMPHFIRS